MICSLLIAAYKVPSSVDVWEITICASASAVLIDSASSEFIELALVFSLGAFGQTLNF